MSMHFRDFAEKAAADGVITPEEILTLRREGWANGRITPDEAEAIFMANDKLADPCPEWSDFFVEAIREFIINTLEPKGYVTQEQGDWLIAKIDHNGLLCGMTELELLVRVFEKAQSVPENLREYALSQVEHAVLTGTGPTRCGGELGKGNVTDAEAKLMRRIIFASGSERPAAVSRSEADMLFRIKDATLDASNAPEWKRLFVQGVGNYLMGFAGHAPLSRDRAAELETFMNDRSSSIGSFFRKVGKHAVRGNFYSDVLGIFEGRDEGPGLQDRVASDREVTDTEKMWLEDRIDANGIVDEYDQAVLDFIAEETGQRP
ncbi:MAG: hypothetical protein KDE55_23300 [Novosphingobium sp.]|nr:hypothetical protein [Novosphingobium sp.]